MESTILWRGGVSSFDLKHPQKSIVDVDVVAAISVGIMAINMVA